MQINRKCDIIQMCIDERMNREIEKALDAGYLVELIKLRDGTLKVRTVRKKEIKLPTA